MKTAAIVWGSDFPLLTAAATREGVVLSALGVHDIGDPTVRERFLSSQDDADLILLHPSQDAAWDILIPRLRADIPIVSFGHNQEFWTLSTVPIKSVAAVSAYVTHGEKRTTAGCSGIFSTSSPAMMRSRSHQHSSHGRVFITPMPRNPLLVGMRTSKPRGGSKIVLMERTARYRVVRSPS